MLHNIIYMLDIMLSIIKTKTRSTATSRTG